MTESGIVGSRHIPIGWGDSGPEGAWTVSGGVGGQPYQGILQIRRQLEMYELEWSIGNQAWPGTALLGGGLLAAARADSGTNGRPAIVWYTLAVGGDLIAIWNSQDIGARLGTGFAPGGRPGRLAGERWITYFSPSGNPYDVLRLRIEPLTESAYKLAWFPSKVRQPAYEGIGLAVHDGLIAAWAPAGQLRHLSVLIYEVEHGSQGSRALAPIVRPVGGGGREVLAREPV